MKPHDEGHRLTEEELADLERKISEVYREARESLDKTIQEYFARLEERDKHQQELLKAGKITEEQYKQWRLNQIGRGERFEALRDEMARRYTEANEVTTAYINDTTPGIYSLNRNYAAYTIEKVAGDVGFTMWDEQTVRRLLVEDPDLMPEYPAARALKRGIDLAWGKQQITASVTSGILMGRSVGKIATDLQDRIEGMNRSSALRAARTAITGAQNAGRYDSYRAAREMGIKFKIKWLATLDNRTRHAHGMLDGQKREVDEPFEVEGKQILYPGDSKVPYKLAHLIYNCRCRIVVDDDIRYPGDIYERRAIDPETGESVLIEDMTYQEWVAWKKKENKTAWDAYMKKGKNASSDKKQHEKYRKLLKGKVPEGFAGFQNLKYNEPEKWKFVKLDYERRSKLIKHPEKALPNAEKAISPKEKYTQYLFNPENKVGWAKGQAIIERLGYSAENWESMRREIIRGAKLYPANRKGENGYGELFDQRMVLYGKNGTPANVVVGWILKEDGSVSMTSAYMKEVK